MTLALTIYAFTTKKDISYFGGSIFIISSALLMLSIFNIFFYNSFLDSVYTFLGVIIYGFYLIYDT